jgi:hypothetical protein
MSVHRYRKRAQDMRHLAEGTTSAQARGAFLLLAEKYEKLAREVARREKPDRKS